MTSQPYLADLVNQPLRAVPWLVDDHQARAKPGDPLVVAARSLVTGSDNDYGGPFDGHASAQRGSSTTAVSPGGTCTPDAVLQIQRGPQAWRRLEGVEQRAALHAEQRRVHFRGDGGVPGGAVAQAALTDAVARAETIRGTPTVTGRPWRTFTLEASASAHCALSASSPRRPRPHRTVINMAAAPRITRLTRNEVARRR
jgi:hypothetical protein